MAAIDKIYGTQEDRVELKEWLKKNKPSYLSSLITNGVYIYPDKTRAIAMFDSQEDRWLWRNCDLTFVRERLLEQYSDINVRFGNRGDNKGRMSKRRL